MSDRHPAVCSPEAIRSAYAVGLRIVWEEAGRRDEWQVIAVDEDSVTTRFIGADGSQSDQAATFAELSDHSAFPVGPTIFVEEDFATPAGQFRGTHCIVQGEDGARHFFFSADHPGPPVRIEGPGFLRQQVERSDL